MPLNITYVIFRNQKQYQLSTTLFSFNYASNVIFIIHCCCLKKQTKRILLPSMGVLCVINHCNIIVKVFMTGNLKWTRNIMTFQLFYNCKIPMKKLLYNIHTNIFCRLLVTSSTSNLNFILFPITCMVSLMLKLENGTELFVN